MKKYGEILKEHRLARGLTLKDIEKATGINNGNLSRWERDEVLPNIDSCVLLAEYFDITLDELLGISDSFEVRTAAPIGDVLSSEERELLKLFRELSPFLKGLTLDTVRGWSGNSDNGSLHKKA